MIGLDTNVIVRYLVQDDPAQSKVATRIFEDRLTSENHGFISCVTLCEVVWVLKRGYKVGRREIASILKGLLDAEELEIESRDIVWRALADFESGKADFSDYLIGQRALSVGATTTFTFDETAAKSPLFSLAR